MKVNCALSFCASDVYAMCAFICSFFENDKGIDILFIYQKFQLDWKRKEYNIFLSNLLDVVHFRNVQVHLITVML